MDIVVMDLVIVFLHYNNFDDTAEAIKSFKENLDTKSYRLIIVDNKSPNGTGKGLIEKYKNDGLVDVVLSNCNRGNDGGLNVGIDYAKEHYQFKYLVVSDNDVLLEDNHFYKHVVEEYQKSHFAILAPMIITPDGRKNDNPIFDIWYSRNNANYDLRYWKTRLRATKLGLDNLYMLFRRYNPLISKHKAKIYDIRKNNEPGIEYKRRENVVAHGCFRILSPTYFEHFDRLDDRTFMYAEEDITYAHLLDKKLLCVYNPDIVIYHKGGSSVKKAYKNSRKRKIFLYSNYIKAIKAYLLLLDELGL